MEEIDLDIENYNFEDILDLFSIPADFAEQDLRLAKKVVLRTHPDKSGLDKKYFLFFSAAYKLLYRIHEFRTKRTSSIEYNVEKTDKDLEKDLILERFQESSGKDFNKAFNEMFEKVRIKADEGEDGYGSWLQSNEGIDNRETSKSNMNEFFDKKKKETSALVRSGDIMEMGTGMSHSSLTGEKPEYYSSEVFSSLQYDDLKRAHVESVVPVTQDDYTNKKQFSNATEMASYRNKQNMAPCGLDQAKDFLKKRDNKMNNEHISTAYKLAKQEEDVQKANDSWWGNLRQLTNG